MKQAIVILAVVVIGETANILGVFPFPSKSHHILGSVLLENLAKRGHNVTYISSFTTKAINPNFTNIVIDGILKLKEERLQKIFLKESSYTGSINRFSSLNSFNDVFFEDRKIQELLRSGSKFDLMIHSFGMDATLALAHHFDVPVIVFSPFGGLSYIDSFFGHRGPISYVPNAFLPFSKKMTFTQRLRNVLAEYMMTLLPVSMNPDSNRAIQKYLPGAPKITEIQSRIEMAFINSHVSTESPRPYIPSIVQIGGFHLQEPEALPIDLKQILDNSTEGVVYFSFGTNVKITNLPKVKLDTILKSLGQLSQKVLIKLDEDIANKPDNVEIRSWYPQRGILAHPNVKLFIGHGGYGGCTESLFYGIPMICIPMGFDQPKNCADVERNGYGINLPVDQLNSESLEKALRKVLSDHSFIAKAKLKSELYRDQEMNPMDRAAYWVNHVVKNKGAKHLRLEAFDLSWYEYYLLDVVVFVGFFVMMVTLMFCYILKYSFYRFSRMLSSMLSYIFMILDEISPSNRLKVPFKTRCISPSLRLQKKKTC